MKYEIRKISNRNIRALDDLAKESASEGYYIVQRAIDQWNSGVNCFSKPGEVLWGVFLGRKCVAIGGLNADPYADDPKTGRVRRLFVSKEHRRKGIARLLLGRIIRKARKQFHALRLLTNNPNAAILYESLGFEKIEANKANYEKKLKNAASGLR